MHPENAPRRLVRAEAVLAARRRRMTLVLEDAIDPHNVSAVLRTCEAFGIQDVHLVTSGAAPPEPNPGVSLGAERWLTLHRHDGAAAAIEALRACGYRLFVGDLRADATALYELPRDSGVAYVFGSEHRGISQAWLDAADARFLIPTAGFTGSLNLSVAAALVVYDRLCVRAAAAPTPGDLTDSDKATLRATWYETLAHGNAALARDFAARAQDPPPPSPTFPVDRSKR